MVTLPKLESYSEAKKQEFLAYSPLFGHYLGLISREATQFADQLRQKKHQHWLECAFATLSRKHSPEEICHYWTLKTEEIIEEAWLHCQLDQHAVTLLAFGKLGSKELNLSSDIDIVFVKANEEESLELTPKVKKFIRLLNETTAFGFIYRVDTNLRPGGPSAPLVPTLSHFINYYDVYTEAWNRLSFIRMRPLLGPSNLQDEVVSYCHRLAYPRRLDFSVINEIKGIRSKLKFQWRKAAEPFNIKFHPGGIRDLELYIHALQTIYGGRNIKAQNPSLSGAIKALVDIQALSQDEYHFVSQFYWQLRDVENHIHIYDDQHNYTLKKEVLKKIKDQFPEKLIIEGFKQATALCDHFFTTEDTDRSADSIEKIQNLADKDRKAIDAILSLQSHSFKKREHQKLKISIVDKYLAAIDNIAIDTSLAIQIFRDFVFSIRSKSSLFYLLNRHEELLENLAWLFSVSPYVGQILCRRPELMDSFALGRVDIHPDDDIEKLLEDLTDYKLLGQLISIIYLFKNKDISSMTTALTEQADFIVTHLLNHLETEDKIEILSMGKWSGFELGVRSDLDFVFLTENTPSPSQIKIARRFINLITTSSNVGKLYNIDLRLKPNQSSGPLLIQKSRLLDFLKNKAQAWQKQAYLRSRLVGHNELFLKDHLDLLHLTPSEADELTLIHHKLIVPATSETIDVKFSEGGIIHTEFLLQKLCLTHKCQPKSTSTQNIFESLPFDKRHKEILDNYHVLRRFEQVIQICNDSPSTKVGKNNHNLQRIGKLLGEDKPFARLQQLSARQTELLKSLT